MDYGSLSEIRLIEDVISDLVLSSMSRASSEELDGKFSSFHEWNFGF